MLQYPTILGSSKAPIGKSIIAFEKYDGSNLRFEWSPKQGWHKFGTRKELFDSTNPLFSQSLNLFHGNFADEIVRRVKDFNRGCQRITAFTEFFGPSSFAGLHVLDEPKELKLLDIFLFKKGFIKPKQFVKLFGDLPEAPTVIYTGNLNKQFIDEVRKGAYPVYEGVVCKGDDFMIKIKTDAYFKKLTEVYGTDYRLYWE